ncbi:unnamed protein product [Sphagnum jensenii]|uniref:Uncharacterized protein n=1 Tax=Sphagnum jensenii TaxID=128206 RepID=A0ABP0VU95_9BRYO
MDGSDLCSLIAIVPSEVPEGAYFVICFAVSNVGANIFRTILMAPLLEDADCYLDVHNIGDVDVGRFSSENCQFSYCGLVEVTG